MRLEFAKGHGTENDFVLVVDPDGSAGLDASRVAELCDRRAGIGADGLIIATRSERMPERERELAAGATWFMDYRNADGSVSEMCGNGVRVFAQFLRVEGLEERDAFTVGTRAGVKQLRHDGEAWSVDLGAWQLGDEDVTVAVGGLDVPRPGMAVSTGNAHVVVALASDAELDALDLQHAPVLDPAPAAGANVEFVVPRAIEPGGGHIRMRVHERGSGETLSCGTGAVAAAIATRHWAGGAPEAWRVDVPGGELGVAVHADRAWLTGPAELVFRGQWERSTRSTR